VDNELTFLSSTSDAAILDRFRKNVEDVGLNRTVPFYLSRVKLGDKVKAGETVIGEMPSGK